MTDKRIVVLIAPVPQKNPTENLALLFKESLTVTSAGNKPYVLIVPTGPEYDAKTYEDDFSLARKRIIEERKNITAFYFYGEEVDEMTLKWAHLAHILGIEMVPKTKKMKEVLLEYTLQERKPDVTESTPSLQKRCLHTGIGITSR